MTGSDAMNAATAISHDFTARSVRALGGRENGIARLVGVVASVIVHARSQDRAAVLVRELRPTGSAMSSVAGNLGSLAEVETLATSIRSAGIVDAIVHKAAVGRTHDYRMK